MNKDEKEAWDARIKEEEALQKKQAAALKRDSDAHDAALKPAKEGSAGTPSSEEKSGTEKKS